MPDAIPTRPDADASDPAAPRETVREERIPVAEERLRVDVRQTERVGARVSLSTHSETVEVAETLRRDRHDVQRVPVDVVVDAPPAEWVDADGTFVIPVVEEVLVRRYRIVEEIRLTPRQEVREHRETVTLRRQEAVVDAPGAPAPSDPSTPSGGGR